MTTISNQYFYIQFLTWDLYLALFEFENDAQTCNSQ